MADIPPSKSSLVTPPRFNARGMCDDPDQYSRLALFFGFILPGYMHMEPDIPHVNASTFAAIFSVLPPSPSL